MNNVKRRFRKGALATAADAVRSAGRYGDTHVVHVNERELEQMADAWGDPTINPHTGLPEFFDIGGLISGVAQLASAVTPIIASATAKKPTVVNPPPSYPGTVGNKTSAPSSAGHSGGQYAAPSGGGLSGFLGKLGGSEVLWPALLGAGITAIDQLYDPDAPSVADQLAEIQAAHLKNNPGFYKPLPKATFDRGLADMSGVDWANYGKTGGEADFFTGQDNPQVVTKAHGGIAQMREAGRMYKGPGGGQDDKIPAMLSNNEYVIDATTVADLGDGDPDEGARKLDQFRAAVGRQKGRKPGTVPPKARSSVLDYLRGSSGAMPTERERLRMESGAMPAESEMAGGGRFMRSEGNFSSPRVPPVPRMRPSPVGMASLYERGGR